MLHFFVSVFGFGEWLALEYFGVLGGGISCFVVLSVCSLFSPFDFF